MPVVLPFVALSDYGTGMLTVRLPGAAASRRRREVFWGEIDQVISGYAIQNTCKESVLVPAECLKTRSLNQATHFSIHRTLLSLAMAKLAFMFH